MASLAKALHSLRPKWAKPLVQEPIEKVDFDATKTSSIPWTALCLMVLAGLGFAASLVEYLQWKLVVSLVGTIIWATALASLVLLRPRTFSLILCTFIVTAAACPVIAIAKSSARPGLDTAWQVVSIAISLVSLFIVLNMPMRHPSLNRDGISRPYTTPQDTLRSPEDNLSMWQWMTVSWMAPLVSTGKQRQLNDDDVWQLPYHFQHTPLHEAFRNLTGTVVIRLIKANWIDIVIMTALGSIELAANYSAPVILQRLLQAMQLIDIDKRPAINWAALTLFVQFAQAQSSVFNGWYSRRAYERSRGAMITMLHEKVLHRKILGGKPKDGSEKEGNGHALEPQSEGISDDETDNNSDTEEQGLLAMKDNQAGGFRASVKAFFDKAASCIPSNRKKTIPAEKEPASMGKILNLMRNDVYETAQRFWEFQMLLGTPIGLVLSIILIWRMIGWSSLVGIAVVVIAQVINGFLARILLSWERVRRKATDHKLQKITEYVEAIRHLRWYGWHNNKLKTVMEARQGELNMKIITFVWSNAIMFVNTFASGILPVAAFWAYTTLAGQKLSVDIAFPALQLFGLLQANLRDVPNLITIFLNAAVAVGRIEDFMSEPDIAEENTVEFAHQLELKNADFAWPGKSKNVLHQLNITFPPGLSVVMGPVASGKTALLQAMLGELDLKGGQLFRLDEPIGYCAQTPWLESMTIRDNILFCSPYDEQRYKQVLDACALLPDLAIFKQGDMSPIGENGIGLSGGQKARVALARAVYSHAQILLLDDPLSALDQQTAEWIVAKCLSGSLVKGRTVVLATHRTDLCQSISEQVVEMSNGHARVYKGVAAVTDTHHLAKVDSSSEDAKKTQESDAIKEKFEDEEFRAHGGIEFKVYWEYIKAGKLRWWALVVISVFFWRFFDYAQAWFLKEWGEAYKTSDSHVLLVLQRTMVGLNQASPLSRLFERLPDPAINPKPWLFWFMILVILQAVAFLLSQVLMLVVTYTAGKNMFARIMVTISNATFHFYDVTPIGRLMNRLTGDVGTVDGPIASQFLNVAWELISWVSSIAIIASVTPLFLIFALALTAAFTYVFFQFLPTSQSLRRLEMVSLSPLMSNFGALLNGLITVRAFHAQSKFQDRVVRVTDAFQKMDHFYWSLQHWLQYRFENLSSVSTFLLTMLAIYSGLTPGLTAFVLIAAQRFVQSTYRLCKQYGQLQLDFVSVERVVELLHLEQENPGTTTPPASWPLLASSTPAIEFSNVTIRYAPHHDPALKNISFSIPSGSSTAIIGRTGSGKSTMALALLSTITPESGQITIDGIDIATITKQDLRTRITFLAQDPVLFQGTLRSNLDPMSDYSDDECSTVISRIHGDTRYNWNLDTSVEAGGKNLSQGQRQLVGLARAILRRSAIVIMDEATASVDLDTSWEVQRVLKEELKGSTVVTIAHRASAVRDCDHVVRLDKGCLVAFGTPEEVEGVRIGDVIDDGNVDGDGNGRGSGGEEDTGEGSSKSASGSGADD